MSIQHIRNSWMLPSAGIDSPTDVALALSDVPLVSEPLDIFHELEREKQKQLLPDGAWVDIGDKRQCLKVLRLLD